MKEPDVRIRPATGSDARALSDLALRSKAHWGYSPDFMEACRAELTYTADQIDAPEFVFAVAELSGSQVGFYALERLSTSRFNLTALFVEPDVIGAGIGRVLMRHATEIAANEDASDIVVQSDPNARQFYERVGARYDGETESDSIPGRYLPTLVINLD